MEKSTSFMRAERDRARAALHVGFAVGNGREPRLDGHRHPFDLQVRQLELLLDRFGHLLAEIDRVAAGSLLDDDENGRASAR